MTSALVLNATYEPLSVVSGRRAVVLEHLSQGLPEEFEIAGSGFRIVETRLLGEGRVDETVHAIQTVGDRELSAHRAVVALLFFGFLFGRHAICGRRQNTKRR